MGELRVLPELSAVFFGLHDWGELIRTSHKQSEIALVLDYWSEFSRPSLFALMIKALPL